MSKEDKVYLKDEDGETTEEWVIFADYRKMPAAQFFKLASIEGSDIDEIFDILGKYVADWHILDGDNKKIHPPKKSKDWRETITYGSFQSLMGAFASMFPGTD